MVQRVDKKAAASIALTPMEAAAKLIPGEQKLWAKERYSFPAAKLDPGLRLAWQTSAERGKDAALAQLKAGKATLAPNGEDVVVIVFPSPDTAIAQLEIALRAVGATIVRSGPDTIKAALPIDRLGEAAQIPGMERIRNLLPPHASNITTTEGLPATLANVWHAAGQRGAGVKIAVVDSGYANLATLKAQDEIPASATEINYTASGMGAGSIRHGSACAEIVYDMAPHAQMYLFKIDDVTDLLAVKDYCIANGIQVVSCSMGWSALNFHDGIAYPNWSTTVANHPVTAVDLATSAGILWVNSAGNHQRQHTLIDWRDGGTPDNFLDWNSSQGHLNVLWKNGSTTIAAGITISVILIWNHWPLSSQDFDLRLYRNTGSGWTLVAESAYVQNGDPYSFPFEQVSHQVTVAAQYAVAVVKVGTVTTPTTFILQYYGVDEPTFFGYGNTSTPAPGSIRIPADAASAFTVGAIDHASYTTGPIEDYSSLGPNNRAFTGGSAVTKPDICGPVWVSTVSEGNKGFGGTSCATPHIAGLAALVKGANPRYSQSQIKQYIEANGRDLGAAGKDSTYGSGAARLPAPAYTGNTTAMVGVPFSLQLLSAYSIKGLPKGLKYNAATRTITGVPRRPGTYTVTLSAPGVATQTFQITAEALPAWATGTFAGQLETDEFGPGSAGFSVSPIGRVSGKLLFVGKRFSFSSASYQVIGEDGEYRFEALSKAGKETFPVAFSVYPPDPELELPAGLSKAEGVLSDPVEGTAVLYRYVWKDAGMAAGLAPYVGYYTAALTGDGTFGSGYLAFTVAANGNVKTAGKLADGTAVSCAGPLVLDWDGRGWTLAYAAPKAYAGGVFHGAVEFVVPEPHANPFVRHLDGTEAFHWESLAPTATGDYGGGFLRELELIGGWYDKLADLRETYADGLTVGDVELPALQAAVKVTDWNEEGKRRVSWTEVRDIGAQEDATPAGLGFGVHAAGSGFLVPKTDKVLLLDKAAGEFDYQADTNGDGQVNTSGLTFRYAKATGLFSGAFKAWYDYVAAEDLTTGKETYRHASRTFRFQGALIPGREDTSDGLAGCGYYLVPEKVVPDAPARPYTFNRSIEFLLHDD